MTQDVLQYLKLWKEHGAEALMETGTALPTQEAIQNTLQHLSETERRQILSDLADLAQELEALMQTAETEMQAISKEIESSTLQADAALSYSSTAKGKNTRT